MYAGKFGDRNHRQPMPIAITARARSFLRDGHRAAPSTNPAITIEKNAAGVRISATPVSLYAKYVSGWPIRGLLVVYCWCQNAKNRPNENGCAPVSCVTFHASNAYGSRFTTYAMCANVPAAYTQNSARSSRAVLAFMQRVSNIVGPV